MRIVAGPSTPWTVRECTVTIKDTRGFTHTTRIHTSSLMRAAAHVLKQLEEANLLEGCDLVGEAQVEIVTRTVHTIHISKVRDWLRAGAARARWWSSAICSPDRNHRRARIESVKLDVPDEYVPLIINALEHFYALTRARQQDVVSHQKTQFSESFAGVEAHPRRRRGHPSIIVAKHWKYPTSALILRFLNAVASVPAVGL
jgi:hypothetical protein